KAGNCAQADEFPAGQQPGMNLEGRPARDDLKLAAIAQSCAQAKQSQAFLKKAAASADSADLVWSIQARKILGAYDAAKAEESIASALTAAENRRAAGSQSASWWYNLGLLQSALDRKAQAKQSFEQVLVLPDAHMFHHLARE